MRESKKTETLKKFALNLKKCMAEQGVTGAKMSRDLNVTKSSISQWMNGINFPGPDTLKKLADYLNVSTDYLYGDKKEQSEYTPPDNIETYDQAVEFLKSLNLLRAYGGVDLRQKSEEQILNLARTIHSVLKMQKD